MYIPPHFREERPQILRQLVREHSLAVLITVGEDGPIANHVPLMFDGDVLRGHLSRANPQVWQSRADVPALAIFQGPSAYVTPSWYQTKQETGKVVPTYTYAVVHARGPITFIEDLDRLENHVRALTSLHEEPFKERWSIDDAPRDFIRQTLKGIVGIEIAVTHLEGKWKMSQNRDEADRAGVVRGLRAQGNDRVADWVAALHQAE